MSNPLINKGFNPLSQLSVFLGVWGACFLGAVVATLVISLAGGLSVTDTGALLRPENRNLMIATQAVTTFFVFGLPAIIFAFVCYKNGWQALGFGSKTNILLAILAIVAILATGPLTEALGEMNKAIPISAKWKGYFDRMETTYEEQVKAMMNIKSIGGLLFSIVLIAALPAIFEELFFRGALQGLLSRWWKNPWLAIFVTALIFSAIHFSWYGFFPRVMLGVVLGAVYYLTGNLWYSILMHFVNNAAAVIYMYIMQQQGKPIEISSTSVFPAWAAAISLLVLVGLVYIIYKKYPAQPVTEIIQSPNNPFVNNG
jgi:membrane protease YdiL (CAAX protease family)